MPSQSSPVHSRSQLIAAMKYRDSCVWLLPIYIGYTTPLALPDLLLREKTTKGEDYQGRRLLREKATKGEDY